MDSAPHLGKAQSFIVIAIELRARDGGAASETGRQDFAALLGSALAHACTLQPCDRHDESWACTALIPDTGQTLALLRRLEKVLETFRARHPGDLARFLVHYGLAFASRPGQSKIYFGSALRAAHSHLGRLPTELERGATTEFLLVARSWRRTTVHFQELPPAQQHLGLHPFTLDRPPQENPPIHLGREAALHDFLASRLATHMGPFAQVLVDSARMSAKTLEDFIEETAREIDDREVRRGFRHEALNYLRSLNGPTKG